MAEESLTDEFYEQAKKSLRQRLAPQRYEHSLSVSDMAVRLARAYGVDERKARLAGLLHSDGAPRTALWVWVRVPSAQICENGVELRHLDDRLSERNGFGVGHGGSFADCDGVSVSSSLLSIQHSGSKG